MFEIGKAYTISASHQLDELPEGHKCARLHGHTYTIAVVVLDELNERGMVVDYGGLDATIGAWIDATLDHRHLNDVLTQPTAERLAAFIHAEATRLLPGRRVRIRVSETPRTWATYPANEG